uniref:Uncharacterized protein n=1 Tax=viral metagenome TaxID=1070528 RepID=A0A6M3Y4C3_9ZZZZ
MTKKKKIQKVLKALDVKEVKKANKALEIGLIDVAKQVQEKASVRKLDSVLKQIKTLIGLLNKANKISASQFDILDKELSGLRKDLEKEQKKDIPSPQDLDDLEDRLNEYVKVSINGVKLPEIEPFDTKLIDTLTSDIKRLRSEFLGKLGGGGNANRQINVNSSVVSAKYADLDFVAGPNVTLTAQDNDIRKRAEIIVTASDLDKSAIWGSVTGTLANQADLQAELDGKQSVLGFTPVSASTVAGTYPTTSVLVGNYSTTSVITGTYPTTSTLVGSYSTTSVITGTYATSSNLSGTNATFNLYPTTSTVSGSYATSSNLGGTNATFTLYPTTSTVSGTYAPTSVLLADYTKTSVLLADFTKTSVIVGTYAPTSVLLGQYITPSNIGGTYADKAGANHDNFSDFVANEHTDWGDTTRDFKTTGVIRALGPLVLSQDEVTISAGAITATRAAHQVDTEADAGTDDLDAITGTQYQVLMLRTVVNTRDVVLVDSASLSVGVGGSFTLNNARDRALLYSDLTTSWRALSIQDNA